MCKLDEFSKFLEYSSNMLEISSKFIWNIPVTYWKFAVGSKMILLIFDMLEAFKNSEKNRISLFHLNNQAFNFQRFQQVREDNYYGVVYIQVT